MLERLFTSKMRVNLLSFLLFSKEKEQHLREIARRISSPPTNVARELDNLEKAGIVKKSKKGNLSIYSIRKECAFLDELKKIFLKTDYLGETLKKKLLKKAHCLCIFGSFAQGNERSSSDIDLFMVSEMNEDELIEIIRKLEKSTKREINYILWNEAKFSKEAQEGHHLLRKMKEGKLIMLVGDEDEFRRRIK